nr:unnamed protein product [Digitaria exilis]
MLPHSRRRRPAHGHRHVVAPLLERRARRHLAELRHGVGAARREPRPLYDARHRAGPPVRGHGQEIRGAPGLVGPEPAAAAAAIVLVLEGDEVDVQLVLVVVRHQCAPPRGAQADGAAAVKAKLSAASWRVTGACMGCIVESRAMLKLWL